MGDANPDQSPELCVHDVSVRTKSRLRDAVDDDWIRDWRCAACGIRYVTHATTLWFTSRLGAGEAGMGTGGASVRLR